MKIVIKETDMCFNNGEIEVTYLIYLIENNNNLAAYIVVGEVEKDIRVAAIKASLIEYKNKDILVETMLLGEYLTQKHN
jgi:hypothetical protein